MSEPRLTHLALYLQRLGFDAPPAPTLETLRQLQLRHTSAFPFENLTTLSGEPVIEACCAPSYCSQDTSECQPSPLARGEFASA